MPSRSGDRGVLIASRGSELALWQARWVEARVREVAPETSIDIEVIRTTGDRVQDVPLSWIGDRGLFTKEIDAALLDGRADIAVHSLKDVPTRLADGLELAAITEREDPRDVLLARADLQDQTIDDLPAGARIGTSSLRRRAQLSRLRPDLEIADLRGNLNTRLRRLDSGDYDAVLLAAAGVIRMGWRDRVSEWLEPARWLPAVGQGALAIVVRAGDERTRALVQPVHDPETAAAVLAERAFLGALEGGCQVPIAALARVERDVVSIDGLVAGLDGKVVLRSSAAGPADQPGEVGRSLARELVEQGADRLLDEVRRSSSAPQVPAP